MSIQRLFFLSILFTFLLGCTVKEEQFPIIPALTFKAFSKSTIVSGDTFSMTVSFTDGDGDIGIIAGTSPRNDTICVTPESVIVTNPGFNYFYKDLRDNCTQFARTEFYQSTSKNKSIKGEVVIRLGAFCKKVCTIPGCSDTVRFELVLRDRAGNLSNRLVTPPLEITGCF